MSDTICLETRASSPTRPRRRKKPARLTANGEEYNASLEWTDAVASEDYELSLLLVSTVDPQLAQSVEQVPCLEVFERWAQDDPDRLLDFVVDGAENPVRLGEAAQVLGTLESPEALAAMIALLAHDSPFVREGAVYGLEAWVEREPTAAEALRKLAANEVSDAVKAAIADVLDP